MDVTDADAPAELVEYLNERHGGVDIVVHNAGITKDKTLGRMDDSQPASWQCWPPPPLSGRPSRSPGSGPT